jgi:CENP-Q, a CENPA-CAD centromere complex subunit
MAIRNENRRATAQGMIEHTINRINTKLEKIPLPLGMKDRHFDFERVIGENVCPCGQCGINF